ncbi:MAG TPA: maleylpyruvate isomerase family mycothiol-dependent enzyme [Streptosporangiaceae bacterium]
MTTSADSIDSALSVLSDSHDRLAAAVKSLTGDQLTGPSYCSDWSVAQVLSHLGSGAEIFGLHVVAGLHGREAPGGEQFQAIWDVWNAKSPQDQVRDGVAEDGELVEQLAAIPPEQRQSWRLEFFGAERTLADVIRMRVSEHALHTWDVMVARDPHATLTGDAAGLALDNLPEMAGMIGKPTGANLRVHVTTEHPERHFELAAGPDRVVLTRTEAGPAAGEATLRLPAEAFARLLAGRLDPGHGAPVEAHGLDLDDLRAVFPGF